jgi:MinD superfamily P-loop ATPase
VEEDLVVIELAVVSGKGGTGKTSLTASLAVLAERPVVADCDVDAADLHLVLQPQATEREDFSGRSMPVFAADLCIACGTCVDACRFGVLDLHGEAGDERAVVSASARPGVTPAGPPRLDRFACESCGLCARVCPAGAIKMESVVNGELFTSGTRVGPMAHARLGIAEDTSGKLVTKVRERARRLAEAGGHDLVLIDGPPGIGCPVIASIAGADLLVIVTEPTVAGRHDLERVVELAAHFRLRFAVCVNKWDLHPGLTGELEREARAAGAVAVGRVRYDSAVTEAQRAGVALVEHTHDGAAADVAAFWTALTAVLAQPATSHEQSVKGES